MMTPGQAVAEMQDSLRDENASAMQRRYAIRNVSIYFTNAQWALVGQAVEQGESLASMSWVRICEIAGVQA
jgi:hypothetical protein